MTEFNIKRILVPVDFSPGSINALDTAIGMAKQHEATLLLLNVVETSGLSDSQNDAYNSHSPIIAMTHQSKQELQALQHSVIERFLIPCEIIVSSGIVSSTILKVSTAQQADMIVMGTHGSSGFRETFIGLNAFNVVKSASCPVLTIPIRKKWDQFKKILFPVRPIPAALEKYNFIRKIIVKNDSVLKVLGLSSDTEKEVDFLKDLVWQLNEKLKVDDVKSTTYYKVGKNMAEEVIKMATLMETDLVVLTTSIDSTFRQALVGPYTQYIINNAQFPVLSIKPSFNAAHKEELSMYAPKPFSQEMRLYN